MIWQVILSTTAFSESLYKVKLMVGLIHSRLLFQVSSSRNLVKYTLLASMADVPQTCFAGWKSDEGVWVRLSNVTQHAFMYILLTLYITRISVSSFEASFILCFEIKKCSSWISLFKLSFISPLLACNSAALTATSPGLILLVYIILTPSYILNTPYRYTNYLLLVLFFRI